MSPSSRKAPRNLAAAATAAAAFALAVRLTVRDLWPVTAAIYYSTPWSLLALLFAAAALLWTTAKRPKSATAALALAGFCTFSAVRNVRNVDCVATDDSVRLVFWNIAHGRSHWYRIADELAALHPDLAVLAEAGKPDEELQNFWRQRFPHHELTFPGGGLLVISKLPFRFVQFTTLPGISRMVSGIVTLAPAHTDPTQIRLIAVDLDASPRFDKGDLTARVFAHAAETPEMATVIVGDFNTPIDSRWFDIPRRRYTHAFEESGAGLFATWPSLLPLVAIDHIWYSAELESRCTSFPHTLASDHRPVITHLRLRN